MEYFVSQFTKQIVLIVGAHALFAHAYTSHVFTVVFTILPTLTKSISVICFFKSIQLNIFQLRSHLIFLETILLKIVKVLNVKILDSLVSIVKKLRVYFSYGETPGGLKTRRSIVRRCRSAPGTPRRYTYCLFLLLPINYYEGIMAPARLLCPSYIVCTLLEIKDGHK